MTREDTHPEDKQEAIEEICAKFDVLAEGLLTDSVKHTKVWQRSTFSIDAEKTSELYQQVKNSPLGILFENRKGAVRRGYEMGVMDTRNPTEAAIVVEKFGPYPEDEFQYKNFRILFSYSHHPNERMFYLAIGISTTNQRSISSFIFQPDMFETGYEGSDHRSVEGDYDSLKFLYELFEDNTQGNQLKEVPFKDQLTREKMVNQDTGEAFYYDPKREGYFNKAGVKIDSDDKPLGGLPAKNPRIKVVAEYSIQELEEEEKNPFV